MWTKWSTLLRTRLFGIVTNAVSAMQKCKPTPASLGMELTDVVQNVPVQSTPFLEASNHCTSWEKLYPEE